MIADVALSALWVGVKTRALPALGLAIALSALGMPLAAELSIGDPPRAIVDVGLFAIWLVASGLGITLGATAFADLHDGRAVLWLVRPIGRAEWAVARVVGLAGAAVVGVLAVTVAVGAVAVVVGASPTVGWLGMFALTAVEAVALTAIAALLSTVSSSAGAAFASAGLWVAGHLAVEYRGLPDGAVPAGLAAIVFAAIPDLDRLDVTTAVAHGGPLDPIALAFAAAYGLAWALAATALAAVVIERGDAA